MARSHESTPPLESSVSELTLAVGQLLRRQRSANPYDLNLSQSSVLARLERQGPMTTADLARAELMKPQSMKAILARLEEEACVERKLHPTDGRQILFAITGKGLDEHKRRMAGKREWLLAKLKQFEPQDLATLAAAIPLIRRLGESSPP
ncbi:MarR family winged helix-turn-helix transcriptional regulator [Burkholderia sp. Bp9142]|uniref:MarR family winged helix-turn-helix transcriptional regulator n=1 Tax=Burkholderia sp. Bp9142 TaxID=2184573 RepID=UPI000F5A183F|nr:MarR family transcriptional regulator [Burkholderia sp. Bp9142]RQR33319.1 MarR family transcriptional regulator [Burkholderia sp. Bp9142]